MWRHHPGAPADARAEPGGGWSTRCWPGLGLSAIGGGYETVRESIDAAAYPMPGQLIDVGGHRLHLNCTGSGSPTVVLEPGHGEVSEARANVSTARAVRSYLDEFRAAAASAEAATLVDFDSKPLIVVTASRGQTEAWPAAQDKLATLSSNSRHDVVADATHASLYLDQTHAAAAGRAIRDVVASVRSHPPLK